MTVAKAKAEAAKAEAAKAEAEAEAAKAAEAESEAAKAAEAKAVAAEEAAKHVEETSTAEVMEGEVVHMEQEAAEEAAKSETAKAEAAKTTEVLLYMQNLAEEQPLSGAEGFTFSSSDESRVPVRSSQRRCVFNSFFEDVQDICSLIHQADVQVAEVLLADPAAEVQVAAKVSTEVVVAEAAEAEALEADQKAQESAPYDAYDADAEENETVDVVASIVPEVDLPASPSVPVTMNDNAKQVTM